MTTDTLMDDFFASVSFDKTLPWQGCPATAEDGEDVQMSAILKFNPNHAPAGSPIGGQFISRDAFSGNQSADFRALLDEYLAADKPSAELQARYDAASKGVRNLEQKWTRDIQKALSRGEISFEEARKLGYYPMVGSAEYKPLPTELYHVTTAAKAVLKDGLKTRDELSQVSGVGLGGGTSDTISFTTDRKIAGAIQNAMLLAHDYINGKVTPEDLVQRARDGGYLDKLALFVGGTREKYPGTDYVPFVYDVIHGTRTELMGEGYTEAMLERRGRNLSWGSEKRGDAKIVARTSESTFVQRPATAEEAADQRMQLFKYFLAAREAATGEFDPLFFASDFKALGARPREDIQLIQYKPINNKVLGYQVGGMAEWRVHTGEIVKRVRAKKYETIFKFNPLHKPAGTSEGGQFASKEFNLTEEQEMSVMLEGYFERRQSSSASKDYVVSTLTDRLWNNPDVAALAIIMWDYDTVSDVFGTKSRSPAEREEGLRQLVYNGINTTIRNWAGSSSDTDVKAHLIQMAIQEEFGLAASTLTALKGQVENNTQFGIGLKQARSTMNNPLLGGDAWKGLKTLMRAQYDLTQEEFRALGITEVTLSRGMKVKVPFKEKDFKTYAIDTRWNTTMSGIDKPAITTVKLTYGTAYIKGLPASSWSYSDAVASSFSTPNWGKDAMTLTARIPVEDILSTSRTGFGCQNESEMVVLGRKHAAQYVSMAPAHGGSDFEDRSGSMMAAVKLAVWDNQGGGRLGLRRLNNALRNGDAAAASKKTLRRYLDMHKDEKKRIAALSDLKQWGYVGTWEEV